MWIFRTWITRKDGTKDYAKDHGKKAFRFWVGPGPEPDKRRISSILIKEAYLPVGRFYPKERHR